jgi:integrase
MVSFERAPSSAGYRTMRCCLQTSKVPHSFRNAISAAWSDFAAKAGLPDVTVHALRHTHAAD